MAWVPVVLVLIPGIIGQVVGCDSRAAWRQAVPELTLTEADDGGSFEVRPGELFVVQLAEIPATGFLWAVDRLDEQVLQLQDSQFTLAPDSQVGGGGARRLTFQTGALGSSPLHLKLWREWLGDSSITNRFGVTIRVRN